MSYPLQSTLTPPKHTDNHSAAPHVPHTNMTVTAPVSSRPAPPFRLGRHLLAEFYDCDPNVLNNVKRIETAMREAAVRCGATVVNQTFHHFEPYGVSGVVILAESHLAIHTWPEHGYAAVDLFTCGNTCEPQVAYDDLKEQLNAKSDFYSELSRGLLDPTQSNVLKAPFQLSLEKTSNAPLSPAEKEEKKEKKGVCV